MGITIVFDEGMVAVKNDNSEFSVNKCDNAWLRVIGALYDSTEIVIQDNRKNLQEHQHSLSCIRGWG